MVEHSTAMTMTRRIMKRLQQEPRRSLEAGVGLPVTGSSGSFGDGAARIAGGLSCWLSSDGGGGSGAGSSSITTRMSVEAITFRGCRGVLILPPVAI